MEMNLKNLIERTREKRKMTKSEFGFTTQRVVCDLYSLEENETAKKQFDAVYKVKYVKELKEILKTIFDELNDIPIELLTYSKSDVEGEKHSVHNFKLKSGKTLSISTNNSKTNRKVAPPIVGQSGYETLNYHFGDLVDEEIETKKHIRRLIWYKKEHILPVAIDYLLSSDFLVWIYRCKDGHLEYKIIERKEKPEMSWKKKKFKASKKKLTLWNESVTFKYETISIAEAQVHKNRTYKFRLIMDNLSHYLGQTETNNEALGMTAEKVICDLYDIKYSTSFAQRCRSSYEKSLKIPIRDVFNSILPDAVEHLGSNKGDDGGSYSKSEHDFMLDGNKTLSVKTNWGDKVCPPKVGQPGNATFEKYFDFILDGDSINNDKFKELAIKRTAEMLDVYLTKLFDSDYLLWIFQSGKGFKTKVIKKEDVSFKFKQENISFTKGLNEWLGSTTVKYDNMSIGEFQIHKNRNSYKFRFIMKNLLQLLEL